MTITSEAATDSVVWMPSRAHLDRSRILAFARSVGCTDVQQLRDFAQDSPFGFWSSVASWLELDWQRRPSAAFDQMDTPHETRWYVDGALNIADNAVDRWIRHGRGADTALLWEDDNGERGSWTFAELDAEICRVARGLLAAGLEYGDRVGIQLPMVKEAVVAQLACAKIGAITVPIFSGFGMSAVMDRLRLAGVKAHILADGFTRRGKPVKTGDDLAAALKDLASLEFTVVVSPPGQKAMAAVPKAIDWDALGRGESREVSTAVCPTDHPLFIAFTSGTTGTPKGVVLGHAGFAVKAGSDAAFSFNIGAGDVATWITDPGWIMSPIIVIGGLIAGSAVALYSGTPDWPDTDRIWGMVRALGVTMLGLSPTLVRSLMGRDDAPIDTGNLQAFASSGEPWTPDAYDWLFTHAGKSSIPIINYSGGTEVSGAILSNTTAEPIHPCGFAGPLPGMGADIVDTDGHSQDRGLGELALRRPSPGMPLTFWGDSQRYFRTYWDRWPGVWYHGDWVEVSDDNVWFVRGRSDDTLKIAGKRLGPAEVESVANASPTIIESAAIGVPDPVKGEALVVFARTADSVGAGEHELIAAEIAVAIADKLGKPLKPRHVHLVPTLPKTRSGKIVRRVIRAVYLGQDTGDLSSLEDHGALEAIRSLA